MRFSSITVAVYTAIIGAASADQVCDYGVYAVLSPLSEYPPAQNFCAKKYPASNPKRELNLMKRHGHQPQCRRRNPDDRSSSKTTATTATTTNPVTKDKSEELFSSLQTVAQSVAKTFCSCIQQSTTTKTANPSPSMTSSSTTQDSTTSTDSSITSDSGTTSSTLTSTSSSTTKTSSTLTTSATTSISSTTTPSTTTSSTSSSTTSVKAVATSFKISVQVTAAKRQKRLTLWVQFVGDNASVVQNEADASTFTIVDGYLMYGNEYVTTNGNAGYSSFSKSTVKPTEPGTWSESGGQVSFSGAQGFCYTADNSIIIILTQQPPTACTAISLVENAQINVSSSTTTTTTITVDTTAASSTTTSTTTLNQPQTTPKVTKPQTYTPVSTTSRTTTSTISCTEGVYTATSRCTCRWSIRCNSHAVSEFDTQPTIQTAQTWQECTEACNANINCSGLWFDPGSLTCYLYDTPGDNVLYGYNTGPWIALSPLDCDASCPKPTTTKRTATTTSASPTPIATGCRYEEYQATSGGCNCVWPIKCGTQVNTTPDIQLTTSDHHACVNLCDRSSLCQLFTFDPDTSICRIWYNADQPALSAPGVYWCARLDNWCPASQCPAS